MHISIAAHCFYDEVYNKLRDASDYAVAAGKHYRDWNVGEQYAQRSLLESIRSGNRYMGARGNFAEDIALLKLRTPFTLTFLVRPICMDWDNVYEKEQLQVGQTGKVANYRSYSIDRLNVLSSVINNTSSRCSRANCILSLSELGKLM